MARQDCNHARMVLLLLAFMFLAAPGAPGQETREATVKQETTLAKSIEEILARYHLQKKTRVAPAHLLKRSGRKVWLVRVHFLEKEGYQFRDVMRLLEAVKLKVPGAVFPKFDLGFAQHLGMSDTWRLRLLEVAVDAAVEKKRPARDAGQEFIDRMAAVHTSFMKVVKEKGHFSVLSFVVTPRTTAMQFETKEAMALGSLVEAFRPIAGFDAFCLEKLSSTEHGIACTAQLRFK